MAHKKKHNSPVPPGNQSKSGPAGELEQTTQKTGQSPAEVTSAQEQDAKRRIGNFSGTADHPFEQPGGKNDANH